MWKCLSLSLAMLFAPCLSFAADSPPRLKLLTYVYIPLMTRVAPHREYSNALLELALELTREDYGDYRIIVDLEESVIRRQLMEMRRGERIYVAPAMPSSDWNENAERVAFPLMRGLASYRMFLARKDALPRLNAIQSLAELKTIPIGQGQGWSTSKILEAQGFDVAYGGPYPTLMPMLEAGRFDLLMRGVYEIEPELAQLVQSAPALGIVDQMAVYTYLPMYFFVSKNHEAFVGRLQLGLQRAFDSGRMDALYQQYFASSQQMIEQPRKVFALKNTNIPSAFFDQDRPYLLPDIVRLHTQFEESAYVDDAPSSQ